jgi:hypothetical protein
MIAFAAWSDAADCARFTGSGIRVDPSAQI